MSEWYANNAEFQLISFAAVRLPLWVAVLLVVLLVEYWTLSSKSTGDGDS